MGEEKEEDRNRDGWTVSTEWERLQGEVHENQIFDDAENVLNGFKEVLSVLDWACNRAERNVNVMQ